MIQVGNSPANASVNKTKTFRLVLRTVYDTSFDVLLAYQNGPGPCPQMSGDGQSRENVEMLGEDQ